MVADRVFPVGPLRPLRPCRQRVERQLNSARYGHQFPRYRGEVPLEEALYFRGDFGSLTSGQLRTVAADTGARVRIGAATDRDERDTARALILNEFLSIAGPIAADLVIRERHAVAGITDVECAQDP